MSNFRRAPGDMFGTVLMYACLGIGIYFAVVLIDLWKDKQRHDQGIQDIERARSTFKQELDAYRKPK